MTASQYIPKDIPNSQRLIVALDFNTQEEALDLVEKLDDSVNFYKVGWQLFLGTGWPLVEKLINKQKKVFLDLKINDIEATVRAALSNIPGKYRGQLELLTIHGNGPTVKAAKAGRNGHGKPYLLMITVLSSMDDSDVKDILSTSDSLITRSGLALLNAKKALEAGCEGLIASGESVKEIRDEFGGNFLIVTPGIRPSGFTSDDHKNTLTPYNAIISGSDYLVVGRPITRSDTPKQVADSIVLDIGNAIAALRNNTDSTNSVEESSAASYNSLMSNPTIALSAK